MAPIAVASARPVAPAQSLSAGRASQSRRATLRAGGASARPARLTTRSLGDARLSARATNTKSAPLASRPAPRCVAAQASESGAVAADGAGEKSFYAKYKLWGLVMLWYSINVWFNIKNKSVYNYFPCPAFVSALHLAVGSLYGLIGWTLFPKGNAIFPPRQIMPLKKFFSKEFSLQAFCHGMGHTAVNFSFGAVAVSFTHTIKAMEPFVAAAISQLFFRKNVSTLVWMSLFPVVAGVGLASANELSFNWVGFNGAMFSNVAFAFRNYLAKMGLSKELNSTNQYIYLSMYSLLWCIPPIFMLESQKLGPAMAAAVAQVGLWQFVGDLATVGLTYHLYNQLCFNAIEAFDKPLTASVGNVAKRCFVIGFSVIYFGNKMTGYTMAGTLIAVLGVGLYSVVSANEKAKAKLEAA